MLTQWSDQLVYLHDFRGSKNTLKHSFPSPHPPTEEGQPHSTPQVHLKSAFTCVNSTTHNVNYSD